ncbi:glycoside hydrolase [Crucibulum laeve]|uniref:alpha-1,2-Mannosidase n=1 Tax=Crucibulum laeve TaxID=68775 RepID=A0A5C3M174_9AGAR|nr:glycoside hydrolase [Crucibulum laeve]
MGSDEYHPINKKGTNLTRAGGIGYTVIDSIDTMQIMGLEDEYQRARDWVQNKLSFERDGKFNTFETTIRVLGGLLSAYHLSEDSLFLERATELADRILPAFDTPSGLPLPMVNLAKRKGVEDAGYAGLVSTAEASTLQLELKYLAFLTDNDEYWEKAEGVMKVIKAARIPSGLAPIFISAENGQFIMSEIRLGSRGDSFYEYLIKQYLQTNGTENVYREMYDDAMQAIHETLIQRGINNNSIYTAELIPERQHSGEVQWRLSPKQDHLVCFLGGSLMLGATRTGANTQPVSIPPAAEDLSDIGKRDWETGFGLVETCMDTYDTATGLSPEIAHFYIPQDEYGAGAKKDWYIKGSGQVNPSYDARYILRPETVESLFIAFRLTGDKRYRDYGWKIFQAIEKHCRIESGGYASILNVEDVNSKLEDKMETFLMSETLKYLYLLFSDDTVLPLDEYVFNTEAHPLPVFTPTMRTGFF